MSDEADVQEERRAADRLLLYNAASFMTAQRAFIVRLMLPTNLSALADQTRAYLALQAFEQYMLAGEDTLHWIFALLDWEPEGPLDTSLLARVDRVTIGVGKYQESSLIVRLDGMSPAEFGHQLKIPATVDIPERVAFHDDYLRHWQEGVKRIAKRRLDDDRIYVRAYNKTKHGLLAVYNAEGTGGPSVDLLTASDYSTVPVPLRRVSVRALPLDIEQRVIWTLQMQAVLQGILTMVLGAHFGEWVATPRWAQDVFETSGWYEE